MTFSLPDFDNKDVVFVGRGKEWQSFEKFIKTNNNVSSIRSIFITKEDPENNIEMLKNLDLNTSIVVKTSGFPGRLMPVPYTTPTRVFFDCVKQLGAKTIGVTGTKGKTTTSTLMHFVLDSDGKSTKLCGNMGNPMLDALEGATQKTIFVIELSSFQLAELEQSPDIAIITNLFRDHIDYHGDVATYWEAKHNIMRYMDEKGLVIYNPKTEMVLHWIAESNAKSIAVNPDETVDMSQAKLFGEHNKLNFLMVKAVAVQLGIDVATIRNALNHFEPVRHRLQQVRTVRGVNFVDDAIGSNPEATVAGITALIKNVGPIGCVMLGGNDRDYDFSDLIKLLHRIAIPKLVLFPDTGQIIRSQLPENYQPEIFEATNMAEAVKWAAEHTPSGSICLLSTAAPSTVLWSSFEEKGSLFQKAVLDLPS